MPRATCAEPKVSASAAATTESTGGVAAGVTLAFNTIGWEAQNILFAAVDALLALSLSLDSGRYATVYRFVRALRQLDVIAPNDVPTLCQQHNRYECPVFENILTSNE